MTQQQELQRGNRVSGWRIVNIDPAERFARVTVGVGVGIAGILLLVTTGSVLATAFAVLLVLAGLDLLITGALAHCPVYARLGHTPRSQRRAPRPRPTTTELAAPGVTDCDPPFFAKLTRARGHHG